MNEKCLKNLNIKYPTDSQNHKSWTQAKYPNFLIVYYFTSVCWTNCDVEISVKWVAKISQKDKPSNSTPHGVKVDQISRSCVIAVSFS